MGFDADIVPDWSSIPISRRRPAACDLASSETFGLWIAALRPPATLPGFLLVSIEPKTFHVIVNGLPTEKSDARVERVADMLRYKVR